MQHQNPSDHARHDATLIAGHAAGDLSDTDRARADAHLAECGDCSELRRDLVAIAAATRSVPAPASLARDLRLTPEQAARLRRGSWLRGFLRPFGAPGSPFRPMATAFTSLGLVGLVIGITLSSGASLGVGAPMQGPAFERQDVPAPAATSAADVEGNAAQVESGVPVVLDRASDGMFYPVAQSSGSGYHLASTPPGRTASEIRSYAPKTENPAATQVALGGVDSAGQEESGDDGALARFTTPPNPLIPGSLALLGIGLLLFGLRIASRRVR